MTFNGPKEKQPHERISNIASASAALTAAPSQHVLARRALDAPDIPIDRGV